MNATHSAPAKLTGGDLGFFDPIAMLAQLEAEMGIDSDGRPVDAGEARRRRMLLRGLTSRLASRLTEDEHQEAR